MKNYLKNFLVEFDYPTESHQVFLGEFDKIYSNSEYLEKFNALLKRYSDNMMCDYVKLVDDALAFSEVCDVHPYTMRTLLHVFMANILKGFYQQKGIPESYWFDSVMDIKYQTLTTWVEKGVWGSSCGYWFIYFFQLKRFGFGRLQIEYIPFNMEYNRNGISLNKESYVFNVHIPKTGTKLDRDECHLSYERAIDFYDKYFGVKGLNVFFCHTWLLFPDNLQIVHPESNIAKFIYDYDVYNVEMKDDYHEVHRIFDMEYDGDTSKLPADNSIRRGYKKWIEQGKKIGIGEGIHIHTTK